MLKMLINQYLKETMARDKILAINNLLQVKIKIKVNKI